MRNDKNTGINTLLLIDIISIHYYNGLLILFLVFSSLTNNLITSNKNDHKDKDNDPDILNIQTIKVCITFLYIYF